MRALAFRLTPGTDLKAELARLAEANALRAGFILTCVGSLSRARLRMPGAMGEAEVYRTFEEPMEIVSLTGTLSPEGPHIHISLSRAYGACVGGHVGAGCLVHTTAELVIGELTDAEFRRMSDPATGHAELGVLPRPAEGHTSET
jgi:hypothetical protein